MKTLWHYIYLDDDTVNDFLAQLEGAFSEEIFTAKTTESGGKTGNVNLGFRGLGAGVQGNSTTTSETSQTFHEPSASKFRRLHEQLEKDGTSEFLSQFNQKKYDELPIGKIVELRARIRRLAWEQVIEELESYAKLANFGQKMGFYDPSTDPTTKQILEQLPELKATTAPDETIVIASLADAPAFKFVIKLNDEKLLRKKSALETEALILAKVEKKLEKQDKPIDIFRLIPRFATLQKFNRQQLRQLKKQGTPDSQYDEKVKYPAIELFPIAIYL